MISDIRSAARRVSDLYYRFQLPSVWETSWGPKLYIDPSNRYERGIAKGTVETGELEFFCNKIEAKSYDRFADIGGFVGIYGLTFADRSAGHVDLFEPIPWNAGRIHRNFMVNRFRDFEVNQSAIGDNTGDATLTVDPELSAEASMLGETNSGGATHLLDVPTITLDDFYDNMQMPDLLKIDVEGAENKVLSGAATVLNSHPDIFMELHQGIFDSAKGVLEEMGDKLEEAGYSEAYHLESGRTLGIGRLERLNKEEGVPTHLFIE